MAERIETIIVGGGQAGLSASWHLKQADRPHLVLDRGRIGDTWRNRWDSFCLVTPNHLCRLPGFPYDGDDPAGFMLRDEIVDYVERFAASFDPPCRPGVDVERLSASDGPGRFRLETSAGEFLAHNVIIAAGTHQLPGIPAWDSALDPGIARLHSHAYRSPGQLGGGAVLVVGSGQSGCQIADDLRGAGREVHLSVGNAGRLPRRYRGKDILEWDIATGYMDLVVDDHPKGHAVRFKPHAHLTGRDGGRTIDLRQMALDGVYLHSKIIRAEGTIVYLSGGLTQTLDRIDRACRDEMESIDAFIAENGLDAPAETVAPVDWQPGSEPEALNLRREGIATVIYATGFRRDFGWIDLPVLDNRGYPSYQRGVTRQPGLYFLGLHWMHTQGSGLFYGVGRDAEYVVGHLLRQPRP